MARPESIEDLTPGDKSPHTLVTVTLKHLDAIPGAMSAYGMLTDTLRDAGAYLDKHGSWVLDLTQEELEAKLAAAQKDWDRGQKAYSKWLEDGTFPTYGFEWSAYLRAEGLTAPKKPETTEAVSQ